MGDFKIYPDEYQLEDLIRNEYLEIRFQQYLTSFLKIPEGVNRTVEPAQIAEAVYISNVDFLVQFHIDIIDEKGELFRIDYSADHPVMVNGIKIGDVSFEEAFGNRYKIVDLRGLKYVRTDYNLKLLD